jgi:hypothetical protein
MCIARSDNDAIPYTYCSSIMIGKRIAQVFVEDSALRKLHYVHISTPTKRLFNCRLTICLFLALCPRHSGKQEAE